MSVERERLPEEVVAPGRPRVAARMRRLGTETAFEVLAKARALEAQGISVVHLEIGEPDFDTPENVVDAAVEALYAGHTHYGPSAGLPQLRAVIAENAGRERGIAVTPEQVVVTPGGKPIMFFAILALVDAGDEVLCPDPGFPIYESVVNFCGGVPVPVPLKEERAFRLDVADLAARIGDRTRLIILNSPQNPTGGILERADLEAIARLIRGRDVMVLSDEIYGRLLYEGAHHSIASLPGMADRTIILDGFSKTYAMTGWRLGYGVMPAWLAEHVTRLMTNSVSCTATFVQHAGLAALRGPQGEPAAMVDAFRRRRDLIVDGVNAIAGLRCRRPKGAFYIFPSVQDTGLDSKTFADRLLEEAGVAVLAGTAFGACGEGYIRLSYANSEANIAEALRRIARFVARLP